MLGIEYKMLNLSWRTFSKKDFFTNGWSEILMVKVYLDMCTSQNASFI